jgi:hypothetical protein
MLSIPLSERRNDDFWAWHYDRKGMFSVRSAYKMLMATREKREAWLEKRPSDQALMLLKSSGRGLQQWRRGGPGSGLAGGEFGRP